MRRKKILQWLLFVGLSKFVRFEQKTNLTDRYRIQLCRRISWFLSSRKHSAWSGLWPVEMEPSIFILCQQTPVLVQLKFTPGENNMTKFHDLSTYFQFYDDINVERFQHPANDLKTVYSTECVWPPFNWSPCLVPILQQKWQVLDNVIFLFLSYQAYDYLSERQGISD